MTERELSEKLSRLASVLDTMASGEDYFSPDSIKEIADELRELSNKKYTPGNVSWADVKQQVKNTKQSYTDKTGKRTPF